MTNLEWKAFSKILASIGEEVGRNFLKLQTKAPEKDKEDKQEVTSSLASSKARSQRNESGCRSGSFIKMMNKGQQ